MTIVERIKALLKEQHTTQATMLSELRMSPNILKDWERNSRKPNQSSLSRIADYLNVSVEYLQGITDKRFPEIENQQHIQLAMPWFEEYEIDVESFDNDNGVGEEYVLTYKGESKNYQQWEFEKLCRSLVEHSKSAHDLVMQDFIAQSFQDSRLMIKDQDELDLLTAFRTLKGMQKHYIVHYCLSALEENARQEGQVSG